MGALAQGTAGEIDCLRAGRSTERDDLRSAFDNAPSGVAVVSPRGVVTKANRELGRMLRRAPDELVGTTFFEITHPDDLAGAHRSCDELQASMASVVRHECRFVRGDGAIIWVLLSTSRVAGHSGFEPHLIMHVEDISERRALEEELRHRALHDPLTSLPNRELLLERATRALTRSHRSRQPTCLFFLDLDGFKAVNDTRGHAAGDEVLRQLATRLLALLRPGDTAARVGGDEFVVLCENVDPPQAALIAERLRAAASEPFPLAGGAVSLTAAVGVSSSPTGPLGTTEKPVNPAALLRRADLSMYDVKRARARALHTRGSHRFEPTG